MGKGYNNEITVFLFHFYLENQDKTKLAVAGKPERVIKLNWIVPMDVHWVELGWMLRW